MGIKVKCTDGMIELGGDWGSALAKVKAINGRTYEPTTKTWSVPVELKHFNHCGHPFDVLSGKMGTNRFESGAHHTRWGNVYSQNEWQAQKESDAASAEAAAPFVAQFENLKNEYRQKLEAIGLSLNGIGAFFNWDFRGMIESGRVQFSSKEREQVIMALREEYEAAYCKIADDEQDAAECAREQVWEKYGIE